MRLDQIWRYPVKSMGGERLEQGELHVDGIAGDRMVAVLSPEGRIVTSRTRPKLLGHHAVLGPDGEPLVDGRPWRDPAVARDVVAAAGAGCRLATAAEVGPGRFDVLPLLVATDGAIAAFGRDGRRLRPNLVIGGVEGLAERGWEGRRLRIGACIVALADLRGRCVMTTFDPDTLVQDAGVLRDIVERFDGTMALNASVEGSGVLRVGDPVELL